MGDGSIPDYTITASSTQQREDGNCQPSNARLTQSANSNTIGWCPDPNDNKPWLQIDLGFKVKVEGMMLLQGSTQGTSVDMNYEYQLEYSDDQNTWHTMYSAQVRTVIYTGKVIAASYNNNYSNIGLNINTLKSAGNIYIFVVQTLE